MNHNKLKDQILRLLENKSYSTTEITEKLKLDFDLVYTLCEEIGEDDYVDIINAGTLDGKQLLLTINSRGKTYLNENFYTKLNRSKQFKKYFESLKNNAVFI